MLRCLFVFVVCLLLGYTFKFCFVLGGRDFKGKWEKQVNGEMSGIRMDDDVKSTKNQYEVSKQNRV